LRFVVLTVLATKTSCSFLHWYKRFGYACCLLHWH